MQVDHPPHHDMHLLNDLVSMATIPTIYPENDALLSDWPGSMMRRVYRSVYTVLSVSSMVCRVYRSVCIVL